jgi:hypothetical protein
MEHLYVKGKFVRSFGDLSQALEEMWDMIDNGECAAEQCEIVNVKRNVPVNPAKR